MGDCADSENIPLLSEAKTALMLLFQFYCIAGGLMNTTLSFISSLNVVFHLLRKFSYSSTSIVVSMINFGKVAVS